MPGYDENNKIKTSNQIKVAVEQLAAYVYMINYDQEKYGSVMKGLYSQKSLMNGQFPKTMIDGNNTLSNHRFDNSNNKYNGNKKQRENEGDKSENEKGDKMPPLTFTQLEGECYCCGKPGHKSPQCNKRNCFDRQDKL